MPTKKKPTPKKTAATKKTTAPKLAPAKKVTAPKVVAKKTTAIKEPFTKTQLLSQIAEDVELTKKQIAAVLESLSDIIDRHIRKRAVGHFILPGLLKIKTVKKPAVKARKGINPFTKDETMFKAKPARTVVKVQPLKKLKEMVE